MLDLSELNLPDDCELAEEQIEILRQVNKGGNIIVDGEAGTGKTFVIQMINALFHNVALTATTGMGAQNICGRTISSLLRLGRYDYSDQEIIERAKEVKKKIGHIEILIIDEYFMLSQEQLRQIDLVLRTTHDPDQLFGGVQMVLVGDDMQLEPLTGLPIHKSFSLVKDFTRLTLQIIHRQTCADDITIIRSFRFNKVTRSIKKRFLNKVSQEKLPGFTLVGDHEDADVFNARIIAEFEKARTRGLHHLPEYYMEPNTEAPYEHASYYVGMQVLHTLNVRYGRTLLVNGDIGIVRDVDIQREQVLVEFTSKGSVWINPHVVEHQKNHYEKEMIDGEEVTYKVTDLLGYAKFIPLIPCYALTVRKSQGQTMEQGNIDPKVFRTRGKPRLKYAAISRFKSLAKVALIV